jgi:hypothetical protein
MEMRTVVLSEISQSYNDKIACSLSFVRQRMERGKKPKGYESKRLTTIE